LPLSRLHKNPDYQTLAWMLFLYSLSSLVTNRLRCDPSPKFPAVETRSTEDVALRWIFTRSLFFSHDHTFKLASAFSMLLRTVFQSFVLQQYLQELRFHDGGSTHGRAAASHGGRGGSSTAQVIILSARSAMDHWKALKYGRKFWFSCIILWHWTVAYRFQAVNTSAKALDARVCISFED